MHVLVPGLVLVSLLVAAPASSRVRCGDDPGDAAAVADTRASADAACDAQGRGCTSAPDHATYVRCVAAQARSAVVDGRLPETCKHAVTRCAFRSTCGTVGSVTCCRTRRLGAANETRCRVESGPADCTAPMEGTACVGAVPSCCDACGPGGCQTTTTSTSSTTTTTSTTLPYCTSAGFPECNGFCNYAYEVCYPFGIFCYCVPNFCDGGSYPTCDGACPAGQRCFEPGAGCNCVSQQCSGPRCLCVPPGYELRGCYGCPAGNNQCGYCAEVMQQFCNGGPCTSESDCPPGDACLDFSACH